MAFSLAQPAHSRVDIKKSIFIGFVTAVAGRPEALIEVARLRSEHPQATHVCWALLAGVTPAHRTMANREVLPDCRC